MAAEFKIGITLGATPRVLTPASKISVNCGFENEKRATKIKFINFIFYGS